MKPTMMVPASPNREDENAMPILPMGFCRLWIICRNRSPVSPEAEPSLSWPMARPMSPTVSVRPQKVPNRPRKISSCSRYCERSRRSSLRALMASMTMARFSAEKPLRNDFPSMIDCKGNSSWGMAPSDPAASAEAASPLRCVPSTQRTARLRLTTSQMISPAETAATTRMAPLIAGCARKKSVRRLACVKASRATNTSTVRMMISGRIGRVSARV